MLILLVLFFPLVSGLPRLFFLPFGVENGDRVIQYNQSKLIFELPPQLALYVHSNGAISDRATINDPEPFPLNYTVIAPLWTNFTSIGNTFYRLVNQSDQSSLGFIKHLLQKTGQQSLDLTTMIVVTWNDMKCINNDTEKCVIARSEKAAVVLFLFSVSVLDGLETNNKTESCINPVVGYNIPNEMPFIAVNTLQDVTVESDVNVSGLWIFPFALPSIPSIRTPTTRRPDINQLNLPDWALSIWNIGQSILTYTAGVGTAVLATCCLNMYKRKRNKQNKTGTDNGTPLSEKQTDQNLSLLPSLIEIEKTDFEESSDQLKDETTSDTKIESKTHTEDDHLNLKPVIDDVEKPSHEVSQDKLDFHDNAEINEEDREKIRLLAVLTPHQSQAGKSYSLPVDPKSVVIQSDGVSTASQGQRSLSLHVSRSPKKMSMLVVRSPCHKPSGMGERTLSWMNVNENDENEANTTSQIITSTASSTSALSTHSQS